MNVLLHYNAGPRFRAMLEEARPDDLDLRIVDAAEDVSFADIDAILHVLRPITEREIEGSPRLRLIQKIGIGVNTIALDAAKANGVAVCNMPGSNAQAVAELTLMLMLAALRRSSYFDPLIRRGDGWRPAPEAFDRLGEIGGKVVGLVGNGAIPQRLTPALKALGAKVIYSARSGGVPFADILQRADIVSLHCPAVPETIGMISRGALGRMKPGAVLVNTARGELVDETSLYDALVSGHLRAAGLDVFQREPASADNPLFGLPNVVVTPHIGWQTPETLSRSIGIGFENIRRVAASEPLLHRVV